MLPAPSPCFLLLAATPAPAPAARGASAVPPPLPAGHGRRGRGAARSLRQLLRPWPATLRIALERRPRPGGAERSGAQRERPRCAPGVAGRQRASLSASLLSHPQGQVSAPRTPGLGGGCSRAARARRGHLPGGHPRVRQGPAPAQRQRDARPSERGATGVVTTLKAPRCLLRLLLGNQGFASSGHGGVFPGTLLCPPSPSRLLSSFSPLPVAESSCVI